MLENGYLSFDLHDTFPDKKYEQSRRITFLFSLCEPSKVPADWINISISNQFYQLTLSVKEIIEPLK